MIVAIIPCRKGSKRLLNKNKKLFFDKPLFCWTVDLALEIDSFEKVIVSTDDEDILQICHERYNSSNKLYALKRTKELATDSTPMWKVVKNVYDRGLIERNSIVTILQVTSPLRLKKDIEIPIHMFSRYNIGVVSIYKKDEKIYERNGAIYIDYYYNWIKNKTVDGQYYLMPKKRSIDIDTKKDWDLAKDMFYS